MDLNNTPAPEQVIAPAAPVEAAPPPVEPVKEAQDDPKFASKFAALSRREQAVRLQEAEAKKQREEYRAYQDEQKLLNENPLEWLSKKGITFDKLTQLALNDGKKPAEMQIQELKESLERERREKEEAEKTNAQKAYENQKQSFITEIDEFLNQNKDTYELTFVAADASTMIYDVIEQHYLKNKRVLPVKDAVEMVEKYFETEVDEKYMKLNKIKSKLAPKEPAPAPAPEGRQSPTLTNSQASSVPTPATNPVKSIDESKREAAKLLKWV